MGLTESIDNETGVGILQAWDEYSVICWKSWASRYAEEVEFDGGCSDSEFGTRTRKDASMPQISLE